MAWQGAFANDVYYYEPNKGSGLNLVIQHFHACIIFNLSKLIRENEHLTLSYAQFMLPHFKPFNFNFNISLTVAFDSLLSTQHNLNVWIFKTLKYLKHSKNQAKWTRMMCWIQSGNEFSVRLWKTLFGVNKFLAVVFFCPNARPTIRIFNRTRNTLNYFYATCKCIVQWTSFKWGTASASLSFHTSGNRIKSNQNQN